MKQEIYRVIDKEEYFLPEYPAYIYRTLFETPKGERFTLWTTNKGIILDPDVQKELEIKYEEEYLTLKQKEDE